MERTQIARCDVVFAHLHGTARKPPRLGPFALKHLLNVVELVRVLDDPGCVAAEEDENDAKENEACVDLSPLLPKRPEPLDAPARTPHEVDDDPDVQDKKDRHRNRGGANQPGPYCIN